MMDKIYNVFMNQAKKRKMKILWIVLAFLMVFSMLFFTVLPLFSVFN